MKFIAHFYIQISIIILTQTTLAANPKKWPIGFLLNENHIVFAFETTNKGGFESLPLDRSGTIAYENLAYIYSNSKMFADLKVLDRIGTCFTKVSEEEKKKNVKPQQVPCPATADSTLDKTYLTDPLVRYAIAPDKVELVKKFQSQKQMSLKWGFLAEQIKNKPLVVSLQKNLKDPQTWAPIVFQRLAESVKQSIITEVLKHRSPRPCTNPNSKISEFRLSSKNLKMEDFYQDKTGRLVIGKIKIIDIEDLSLCRDDETQIQSAYVIFKNGKTTDILKDLKGQFRDLSLIETLDLNKDGKSELVFIDQGQTHDGFSIYDDNLKQLISYTFTTQ